MAQPAAKAQEPSMEEILASIRQIISDDETGPARPAEAQPTAEAPPASRPSAPLGPAMPPPDTAAAQPPPNKVDSDPSTAEPQGPDILELTEDMTASSSAPSDFRPIEGEPDVVFAKGPPEQGGGIDHEPADDERLLSGSASAAVDSAFNTLARTVLVDNARTLEDLVREMLRPMLKSWLDDNLPGVVERLVRAEIERVSRGR